jgi:chitinase
MEFVSYDTPDIAALKAKYVQSKGLAGSMFWDLSTDKVGSQSLVGTTAGVYGALDQTLVRACFSSSRYMR